MYSVKQTCEELYPDYKVQTLTVEQEGILAEDAHDKRRALTEGNPGFYSRTYPDAVCRASRSASPYHVWNAVPQ